MQVWSSVSGHLLPVWESFCEGVCVFAAELHSKTGLVFVCPICVWTLQKKMLYGNDVAPIQRPSGTVWIREWISDWLCALTNCLNTIPLGLAPQRRITIRWLSLASRALQIREYSAIIVLWNFESNINQHCKVTLETSFIYWTIKHIFGSVDLLDSWI